MPELLRPVAEGVGTRSWLIEWQIRTLENQLRAWADEANPPLARAERVQQLEDQVCQLYAELEATDSAPQPREVAETIRELSQEEFLRYLDSFHADQIVGWAGKVSSCPLALFIDYRVWTGGLRVRVYVDHALVDDGYDEARIPFAPWAERIARACTPPDYPAPVGTAISAEKLRAVIASP